MLGSCHVWQNSKPIYNVRFDILQRKRSIYLCVKIVLNCLLDIPHQRKRNTCALQSHDHNLDTHLQKQKQKKGIKIRHVLPDCC